VIDLRWQAVWPDSVSGWCFWASFVALVAIIGVILAGAAAGMARAEGAAGILLKVVQFGFAGVVVAFLLGVVCILASDLRHDRRGR
jgi:uncharacterized membrane protein YedE/YeeE